MTGSVAEERTQAEAAATAWWVGKRFPEAASGRPYSCDVCGAVIVAREGTSLVGPRLECPDCTAREFAPKVAPPSVAQPAPPTARRPRRRRLIVIGLAALAAAGLVVGLVVWAPWAKSAPGVPTNVTTTAANASVALDWVAPQSGPSVGKYLIMRDGKQVGSVKGGTTTYVDKGLLPGLTYSYTVIAEANSKRSAASVAGSATTTAPSPQGLTVVGRTVESVTLRWSAPPDSPPPQKYEIVGGAGDAAAFSTLGSASGSETSTQVTMLDPATEYAFQVTASWGGEASGPSAKVTASTLSPPLSQARLDTQGGHGWVKVTVRSPGGTNLEANQSWEEDRNWQFEPDCDTGPCNVKLSGTLAPPGFQTETFSVPLKRVKDTYSGSTKTGITSCHGVSVANTVTVQITVLSAQGTFGRDWLVFEWAGSLRVDSPRTDFTGGSCPAGSMTAALFGYNN